MVLHTFLPVAVRDRLDGPGVRVDVSSDGPASPTVTVRVLAEDQAVTWSLPLAPFVAALPGQSGDDGRMVLLAVVDAEPEPGFWAQAVDCEQLAAELSLPVTDLAEALRGRLTPWLAEDLELLLHDDAHDRAADSSPAQVVADAVLAQYRGDLDAGDAGARLVSALVYAPEPAQLEIGARLCAALAAAVRLAGPDAAAAVLAGLGPFEAEEHRLLSGLPAALGLPGVSETEAAMDLVLASPDRDEGVRAAVRVTAQLGAAGVRAGPARAAGAGAPGDGGRRGAAAAGPAVGRAGGHRGRRGASARHPGRPGPGRGRPGAAVAAEHRAGPGLGGRRDRRSPGRARAAGAARRPGQRRHAGRAPAAGLRGAGPLRPEPGRCRPRGLAAAADPRRRVGRAGRAARGPRPRRRGRPAAAAAGGRRRAARPVRRVGLRRRRRCWSGSTRSRTRPPAGCRWPTCWRRSRAARAGRAGCWSPCCAWAPRTTRWRWTSGRCCRTTAARTRTGPSRSSACPGCCAPGWTAWRR